MGSKLKVIKRFLYRWFAVGFS